MLIYVRLSTILGIPPEGDYLVASLNQQVIIGCFDVMWVPKYHPPIDLECGTMEFWVVVSYFLFSPLPGEMIQFD